VTGPLEVFTVASHVLGMQGSRDHGYTIELLAREPGPVPTSSGIELHAHRSWRDVDGTIDTLIIPGGLGVEAAAQDRALLAWLRQTGTQVRRLVSVCTGAAVLAEAGLLDGKRTTTHWSYCAMLAQRYPRIIVDPDRIFVRDGHVYTSAGITAGMELALALVEEDLGRALALTVARWLVLFLQRPGGQSQFSVQLATQWAEQAPLRQLQHWVLDHLHGDLSVEALAQQACMSPRNFARVFTREVGITPGQFVERARVQEARRQLEETPYGIEKIAAHCGFGSAETLRRVFGRTLHVSPAEYRRRFQTSKASAG
jgi:transcriptional regulator GlxA family with amidase domain